MQRSQEDIALDNVFVHSYQHMYELLQIEGKRVADHGEAPAEVTMRFSPAVDCDARRYNKPTVEEVAAIFVGADGAPPSNKDIETRRRIEYQSCMSALTPCRTLCSSHGGFHLVGRQASRTARKTVPSSPNAAD